MGRTATILTLTNKAVDQGTNKQNIYTKRKCSSNEPLDDYAITKMRRGTSNPPTVDYNATEVDPHGGASTEYTTVNRPCDTVHYFRCNVDFYGGYEGDEWQANKKSSVHSIKTQAADPIIGTPSLSGATTNSVVVNGNWTPKTAQTTVNVYVQYKRNADPSWSTWGASSGSGTGITSRGITQTTITGLDADTLYNFRLYVYRPGTSNPTTSYYGSTASLATLPSIPVVTTNAASNVNPTTAILNGYLDIQGGVGVNVYFKWDDDTPPVEHQTANQGKSGDGSFQQAISGLTKETPYYFRAYASFTSPAGSPVYGAILSFTTPGDPLEDAAEEDHMPTLYFDRKYKVEDDIEFCVRDIAESSSDRFLTTEDPFAAGDVKISKDGAAFVNTTNLPVQITAGNPGRKLTLTAGEHDCAEAHVVVRDQNGPAFRDLDIIVRTEELLGSKIVDAGQYTNKTAVQYIGKGTGHGLDVAGGATGMDIKGAIGYHILRRCLAQAGGASTVTLDDLASGTNSYYNDAIAMLVAGAGAGQSRVIIGYVGATKVATMDASWVTNPDDTTVVVIISGSRWNFTALPELTALPGDDGPAGEKIQFGFQRFAFKIDQTATLQQLYDANNIDILASRSVADAAGTQTVGKLS